MFLLLVLLVLSTSLADGDDSSTAGTDFFRDDDGIEHVDHHLISVDDHQSDSGEASEPAVVAPPQPEFAPSFAASLVVTHSKRSLTPYMATWQINGDLQFERWATLDEVTANGGKMVYVEKVYDHMSNWEYTVLYDHSDGAGELPADPVGSALYCVRERINATRGEDVVSNVLRLPDFSRLEYGGRRSVLLFECHYWSYENDHNIIEYYDDAGDRRPRLLRLRSKLNDNYWTSFHFNSWSTQKPRLTHLYVPPTVRQHCVDL